MVRAFLMSSSGLNRMKLSFFEFSKKRVRMKEEILTNMLMGKNMKGTRLSKNFRKTF